MELTDIAVIRCLSAAHGFSLSKGLGQNFIVNPGVCPKIVEASGIDETYGALEDRPRHWRADQRACPARAQGGGH